MVHIVVVLVAYQQVVHLRQGIVSKFKHLPHAVVLLFGEVFFCQYTTIYGACNVVARVADTFEFGYFAQHGTHLFLCFIAEVGIAYLVQILRNFYLHVVRNAFVLLYS